MDRARPQGSDSDLIDSPAVTTASYQNRDIGMRWTSSADLSDDSISSLGNGILPLETGGRVQRLRRRCGEGGNLMVIGVFLEGGGQDACRLFRC